MATNDLLPAALINIGSSTAPMMRQGASPDVAIERDRFSKRAGPDVSFKTSKGVNEVYAVFSVDPKSKELRVAVVDADGRLVRMIPPESVAEMLANMERYRA